MSVPLPHDLLVIDDPRYREHEAPTGHPECKERLLAVRRAFDAFADSLAFARPQEASVEAILRVHGREHIEQIERACRAGQSQLDADTYLSSRSFEIARLACGGAIQMAHAIAAGSARTGFAVVRPPGHHAEAARAMGFCLFNNIAVAVRSLQAEAGVERILVVDWDVHHGNGTQHSFEDDPGVLFLSTHQFPFYPGTGDFSERGVAAGEGATINIPLPAGCGDAEYKGALARIAIPAALAFRPEIILVSCGFDAHRADPLAAMQISAEGFGAMTRLLRALADDVCGGRIGFVLEGGYAPASLYEGTTALLQGLLGAEPPPPAEAIVKGSVLARVVDRVRAVHASRYPEIGRA